jgi:16S rRNA (guanine527-N7)-methyltransferase
LEKIEEYQQLVLKWNRTHNLVSKSQASNLKSHTEDSLSIAGFLGQNIMDVGSGGGFPGIPLAIINPEKSFFLVESSEKKAAFLLNTINKLELKNVKVFNRRVESLDPEKFPQPLDIVARALGGIEEIIKLTALFLAKENNKLRLMKTEHQMKGEVVTKGYVVAKKEIIYTKEKDKDHILVTIELGKN